MAETARRAAIHGHGSRPRPQSEASDPPATSQTTEALAGRLQAMALPFSDPTVPANARYSA